MDKKTIAFIAILILYTFTIISVANPTTPTETNTSSYMYTKAFWVNKTHMMDFELYFENNTLVKVSQIGFPVRVN